MKKDFIGILMAAGTGTRLGHGTTKGLVEVAGRPMAFYAIDFLRAIGAKEIIVIGGCDYQKLKEKILNYDNSVKVAENLEYKKGNLYTLLKVLPDINSSFLLANTDHIYKKAIAELVANQLNGITAFCDFDRKLGDDDMKVWHENMKLNQISKKLNKFNAGYIGLTYCDKDYIDQYKKQVKDMLKEDNEKLVVEDVLRGLVNSGADINIGDISGYGWLEVDFLEELKRAEKEILNNKELY